MARMRSPLEPVVVPQDRSRARFGIRIPFVASVDYAARMVSRHNVVR